MSARYDRYQKSVDRVFLTLLGIQICTGITALAMPILILVAALLAVPIAFLGLVYNSRIVGISCLVVEICGLVAVYLYGAWAYNHMVYPI